MTELQMIGYAALACVYFGCTVFLLLGTVTMCNTQAKGNLKWFVPLLGTLIYHWYDLFRIIDTIEVGVT